MSALHEIGDFEGIYVDRWYPPHRAFCSAQRAIDIVSSGNRREKVGQNLKGYLVVKLGYPFPQVLLTSGRFLYALQIQKHWQPDCKCRVWVCSGKDRLPELSSFFGGSPYATWKG